MVLLGALPIGSEANEVGYQVCCAATAAGVCPPSLQAVGPGTSISGGAQGWIASGVWELSCAKGASVDSARSHLVPGPLDPGSVFTGLSRKATICFDALCRLPADLCLRHEGVRALVYRCSTGRPAPPEVWRVPPSNDTIAVVIKGTVIKAEKPRPAANRSTVSTVRQAGRATRQADGNVRTAPGGVVKPTGRVDFEVPADPPHPCVPNPALRAPSNQQVDEGNEAMIVQEYGTAMNKYRAALSINQCNAFAWAALGDALVQQTRATEARKALSVATRLMPNNFHAWANLGKAAERGGDPVAARDAYLRATKINPSYGPANDGLKRVGR